MIPDTTFMRKRQKMRRGLLHNYVQLQRELLEGDPSSSSYQVTIQAFRQMGHALITSGFEEDLDRLLRLRVLDGGRSVPATRQERACWPDLSIIEARST